MDQIETDILKRYNANRYMRLGSDVSVTELMNSPRIVHLKNRHRPKVAVKEMNNIVPSLTGSGLHDQFQRFLRQEDTINGTWQIERRMLYVHNGVRVAGRYDALYKNEDLYDIKVTRSWKFEKGDYREWETQLNMYDYMLWKDGISLKSLKIMGVVLDWQAGKVWKQGYPASRIQIIPMKRWSRIQQEQYMDTSITAWDQALSLSDSKLPLCSATERWASSPVYKLYRTSSSKRATKNFPTQARAQAYLKACTSKDSTKWGGGHIKAHTDNQWKRCQDWCDVADFCDQYKTKRTK